VGWLVQATLLPAIAIMGTTPDIALVMIISIAILRGEIEGAIFGFCAGLFQDIMGAGVIGIFALLGFLTGYFCGRPFRDFFKDNYFLPFFMVLGVSAAYQFVYFIGTQLIFGHTDIWVYLSRIILPRTIYTASAAIPIYFLIHVINKRLSRREAAGDD
jgi:rod shape-determining protein MreD